MLYVVRSVVSSFQWTGRSRIFRSSCLRFLAVTVLFAISLYWYLLSMSWRFSSVIDIRRRGLSQDSDVWYVGRLLFVNTNLQITLSNSSIQ